MAGATADNLALERPPASRTGFSGPAVGEQVGRMGAGFPEAVAKTPKRGAAVPKSVAQRPPKRAMEPLNLVGGQGTARPRRMQAGAEQSFVRVDVSDPGHKALIEQKGLNGRASTVQGVGELPRGEGP